MDEFYTLSQLSITIAGFAALFSVLKPDKDNWTDYDRLNLIRFYMMIEFACMISVFSFLPIILTGYFNTEFTYRISFAVFFCLLVIFQIYALKRNKRYSGKLNIGGISTKIIRLIGITALIFSLLGVFDLLGVKYKTNYIILLYAIFIVDLYFFIRLIYFTVQKK